MWVSGRWNERRAGKPPQMPPALCPLPVVCVGLLVCLQEHRCEMGWGAPRDLLCRATSLWTLRPVPCTAGGGMGRGAWQQQEIEQEGLGRFFLQVDTMFGGPVASIPVCRMGHVGPGWRGLRVQNLLGSRGAQARPGALAVSSRAMVPMCRTQRRGGVQVPTANRAATPPSGLSFRPYLAASGAGLP